MTNLIQFFSRNEDNFNLLNPLILFYKKKMRFENLWTGKKVKISKDPAGFELMTNRSAVNHLTLTHYATLLDSNSGVKKTIYKIILIFIVYFDKQYVTTLKYPIPPKCNARPFYRFQYFRSKKRICFAGMFRTLGPDWDYFRHTCLDFFWVGS